MISLPWVEATLLATFLATLIPLANISILLFLGQSFISMKEKGTVSSIKQLGVTLPIFLVTILFVFIFIQIFLESIVGGMVGIYIAHCLKNKWVGLMIKMHLLIN